MASLLRMPEVAANTTDAVLGTWSVPEGTTFAAGTVLATVETAKAAVDIEADAAGVLVRTLVTEGSEIGVGTPIALLAGPDEVVADVDAALAALDTAARSAPTPVPESEGAPRLFVSPLARRLAREAGIPPEALRGTGPNNRIVRRDVESAIAARTNGSPQAQPPAGPRGFVDEKPTRTRAAIAAALTKSKQTVPHFYLRGTVDVSALIGLRAELNAAPGVRISLNDLVVKATALAHARVPEMNVAWTDSAVRRFDTIDVSVAVSTDAGLVTPVVRGVDRMTISDLAATTAGLAARARTGTLRQHELEGGSVTVTNLGMFGTEEFAAIINPPQSAILAVGAVHDAVVAREGIPVVKQVMSLTASIDHRPLDGVTAARWLRELTGVLEQPVQLLR